MTNVRLVKVDEDGYWFRTDHDLWAYDISFAACRDSGSALRWVEHMASKSWVTKTHLEQFSRLAAEHFKAPY